MFCPDDPVVFAYSYRDEGGVLTGATALGTFIRYIPCNVPFPLSDICSVRFDGYTITTCVAESDLSHPIHT